jgi:hypothetical protein
VYGTGFFVSSRCVITAGHVIFHNSRFADPVKVIFKKKGVTASELFTVQGFTKNEHDNECDYGAVRLIKSLNGAATMDYAEDGFFDFARIAGFPDLRLEPLAEKGASKLLKSDGLTPLTVRVHRCC